MTANMTDKVLMQQALRYMESVGQMDMHPEEWAIAVALRERLAQPGQEPFALLVRKHSWNEGQYECAPPNAPEYGRQWADERVLVYTTPPQRKPLTDDEIADLWGAPLTNTTDLKPVKDFVRDIEAAHGIKGEA